MNENHHLFHCLHIQPFRERLFYKQGKAYATISKVIMRKGDFYGCLSEPYGTSAWGKETSQTHVNILCRSLLLNCHKPQSSKAKLLLPKMPIGIVVYAFTLLWDTLCQNSCILVFSCRLESIRSTCTHAFWNNAKLWFLKSWILSYQMQLL